MALQFTYHAAQNLNFFVHVVQRICGREMFFGRIYCNSLKRVCFQGHIFAVCLMVGLGQPYGQLFNLATVCQTLSICHPDYSQTLLERAMMHHNFDDREQT